MVVVVVAGLDSPSVYRSLSGGGLDTRQLADTGDDSSCVSVSDMLPQKLKVDF